MAAGILRRGVRLAGLALVPLRWTLRPLTRPSRGGRRWGGVLRPLAVLGRAGLVLVALSLLLVLLVRVINPPLNLYQWSESRRLGGIQQTWVPLASLPDHIALSAAAAEDAKFCGHWGFDLGAIQAALEGGAQRGGSTITQQVAKNVYLWQARSWVRKGLEAGLTLLIEATWPKRRIMEVYLNVAEFDTGVFGIEAAARHHFGIGAADLSRAQAARLMAVLPDPKGRSAVAPPAYLQRRARQIAAGAQTLGSDGRGACVMG